MKCELCSSDEPEPMQRLWSPCIEAVVRLWNIANHATASLVRQDEKVQAAVGTRRVPIVAIGPLVDFI